MLAGDGLPEKGSIASFGVYNPPGVSYALAFGMLFAPRELVAAECFAAIALSLITMAGIYWYGARRFGEAVGWCSAMLYVLSSTGWYFMSDLRPRAHPVFVVWGIILLDWLWIEKRKNIVPLLIAWLAAAGYWMLEISPFVVAAAIVMALSYKLLSWKTVSLGLCIAILIWLPYLSFEWKRQFQDLKTLLITRTFDNSLLASYASALEQHNLKTTEGYRVHVYPGQEADQPSPVASMATEQIAPAESQPGKFDVLYRISSAVPRTNCSWGGDLIGLTLALSIVIVACGPRFLSRIIFSSEQTKAWKSLLMIACILAACYALVIFLVYKEPAGIIRERTMWLWPMACWCMAAVVDFVFRIWGFGTSGRVASLLVVAGSLGVLLINHDDAKWKTTSFLRNKGRLSPQIEFYDLVDYVANDIKASGKTKARIGYDLPMLPWFLVISGLDWRYSPGMQYDAVLEFRHNIINKSEDRFGISRKDRYRIVRRKASEPWAQTFFDLSSYPRLQVRKEFPSYIVLRKD
ncbi:MAG TPA: hypothetical protein VIT91_02335 [Chthoniobacterales bacterium]